MNAADAVLRDACGSRFTAAVLRVERGGRLAFERAYGAVDDAPGARRIDIATPFDLASLTKLFVATAALEAVARGALEVDAPLAALVPAWRGTAHERVTLRMLLAHASGMASGADYRTLRERSVETFAIERELAGVPGAAVIYSDLGFIALGAVVARANRAALPAALRPVLACLRTEATAYRPRNDGVAAIPATELDGWRGRVRGFVHDEKAYLMNGIAGHAGLFGTARDVAALAEAYLAHVRGREHALLPPALARDAIAEQAADPVLRRGLGWALKTSDANSCGAAMSRETFGHTGFTGTSVWVDPARDLSIVLLTNAVYFGRGDLRDVRAAVCDAVAAWSDAGAPSGVGCESNADLR